jgi:hypothetical protein
LGNGYGIDAAYDESGYFDTREICGAAQASHTEEQLGEMLKTAQLGFGKMIYCDSQLESLHKRGDK